MLHKASSLYWDLSRQAGCKGGLTTDDTLENPRALVDHDHPADQTRVEVNKPRTNMKSQAKQSRSRPNDIVSQALLNASEAVRANIGNIISCKRDLQCQRRGALPKDPGTLQELVIPDEWKLTGGPSPQPFLIHDTGPEERLVVYSSVEQLQHLGQSNTWYMDGNFAMSPSIFDQLYVIHAPLGDSAVSCVYAFLPGKTSQIYQNLLRIVLDKMEELQIYPDPTTIITDLSGPAGVNTGLLLSSEHVEENSGLGLH